MTLTLQNTSGTTVSGTTSAQAAYPGTYTPTTGDIAIVVAWSKHRTEATEPTAPAAWPRIDSDLGGVTGAAQDAGKVRITYFARELTNNGSGDDAAPLVSLASGTGVVLSISPVYAFRKSSAGTYALAAVYVPQTSSATVWSGVTASTPDWAADDHLLVATGTTSDAPTGMGTRVLTATGCTFGGASEQFDVATSNGDDQRLACATNTVTAGPASAAATVGITLLTTASTGLQSILRIRHVAGVDLVVADSAHGHAADAVTVTQVHELVAADSAHAHASDNIALTQTHALALADSAHGHTADPVVLTQAHQLAAADAAHGHTAETVALTQVHVLSVARSTHGHASETVALTQHHELTVADALHTHTGENVAVTQVHSLVVGNAVHTHTTENVTLSSAGTLTVADSHHGHTSDAVSLTQVHHLEVNDSSHAHTVESVTLAQGSTLAVDDASHSHTADTVVALTQVHVLVVADAAHAHTSDHITLAPADDGSPPVDVRVVFAESTTAAFAAPDIRADLAGDLWGGAFE